jgi:hypothetical protein
MRHIPAQLASFVPLHEAVQVERIGTFNLVSALFGHRPKRKGSTSASHAMSAEQRHAPVGNVRMDFCGPEVQVASVVFAVNLVGVSDDTGSSTWRTLVHIVAEL